MAMKHIQTSSGFEADIDQECINDMELLDAIVELEAGSVTAMPVVVNKICGKEKKRLYEHCRDENGRVPIERLTGEVTAIFEALNAKN